MWEKGTDGHYDEMSVGSAVEIVDPMYLSDRGHDLISKLEEIPTRDEIEGSRSMPIEDVLKPIFEELDRLETENDILKDKVKKLSAMAGVEQYEENDNPEYQILMTKAKGEVDEGEDSLPYSVQIKMDTSGMEEDDVTEKLSDILSDEFGYCHNGFSWARNAADRTIIEITNIDWDTSEE